jgi:N-methylhydantoinase A
VPQGEGSTDAARVGTRRARFEEFDDYIDTPVYHRERLRRGDVIEGPAIIEQLDSTTVLLPRQKAEVVRFGTLIITVEV